MIRKILSVLGVLVLVACGGGGDDSTQHEPDLTVRPLGGDVSANVGSWVMVERMEMACPRVGGKCARPVTLASLEVDGGGMTFQDGRLWYQGQWHEGHFTRTAAGTLAYQFNTPLTYTEPGFVDVYLYMGYDVRAGQSGTLTYRMTGMNGAVIKVAPAAPTKLTIIASPVVISNVSPVGPVVGFDVTCPADSGGCPLVEMHQALHGVVPMDTIVNTYVGGTWWGSFQVTTPGPQTLVLDVPIVVPAGATVRVNIKASRPDVNIEVDFLRVVAQKNGIEMGMLAPNYGCFGAFTMFCKG